MKVIKKDPINVPKQQSETEVLAQQITDLEIEIDLLKGGTENA
ncbi:hypothetical protein [Crassaminicella profunda]|nr:hypothetical protein [Crassaminicella profunda]